ncbi:MAG: trypsin-like peptidase domain-containing protein, partial [Candidatus Binatia bacterium]
MTTRAYACAAAFFSLFASNDVWAAESEKGKFDRLMASSVCVLGEVPGGSFEASGFVVPPGDRVLTTAHGIGDANRLRVKLSDGRVFGARLERLGNERADIALLTIADAKLSVAEFGSVNDLHAGAEVLTIGCPLGFEFSVTRGVVSSLRPSDLGYTLIQTDVPVNPGSSGGPLFDENGRVVGIIKSSISGRQRLNFALPIDLGVALLDRLSQEQEAYELFNQAVLTDKPEEKVALYRRALKIRPDLFEVRHNLALALERQGKAADAETEYRETLRLRPTYTPAALNLGASLYEQRRFREAI